jgi:hypothetical protein
MLPASGSWRDCLMEMFQVCWCVDAKCTFFYIYTFLSVYPASLVPTVLAAAVSRDKADSNLMCGLHCRDNCRHFASALPLDQLEPSLHYRPNALAQECWAKNLNVRHQG